MISEARLENTPFIWFFLLRCLPFHLNAMKVPRLAHIYEEDHVEKNGDLKKNASINSQMCVSG